MDKDFRYSCIDAVSGSVDFCEKRADAARVAGNDKEHFEWSVRAREAALIKDKLIAIFRDQPIPQRPKGVK